MPSRGCLVHHKSAEVGGTVLDFSNQPTYVGSIEFANTTAALAYVQIFWKAAASVTLGTTVADVVIGLPASGGMALSFPDEGWRTQGTDWSMAVTTTRTGLTAALTSVTVWKKN